MAKKKCMAFGALLTALITNTAATAESELLRCRYPEPPKIPDGTRADSETMERAATEVKAFLRAMESSLQCLDTLEEPSNQFVSESTRSHLVTLYNNGVDQMKTIAVAFNLQLQRFEAKPESQKGFQGNVVSPAAMQDLQHTTHH